MIGLRDLALDGIQTALRLFPWPTQPGLRQVGSPGRESPVLVTGNYDLTVRRLMRALPEVDAWIVVAPSGGINVWCAAAGGLLTTHQVVSALKTCGVEEQVSHRRALLPQLAATGVLAREVSRRCGWKIRFGPTRAEDIPQYLEQRGKKSDDMRRVHFGGAERLEMAVAWAAPVSLVIGLGAAALRPVWAAPLIALATLLALAVFFLYDRTPGPRRTIFAGTALIIAASAVSLSGGSAVAVLTAAVGAVALVGLLTFDYSGSTPTEGGSHFDSHDWKIHLDPSRCDGIYSCWEVCPQGCFEKRPDQRKVAIAREELCVRCGACVVQCPQDALFFIDPRGATIPPAEIRRYKMNLLGRRSVDAGDRSVSA